MQLPSGVFAVSQSFEGSEGTVHFSFQGISYEAQMGINAFAYLEHLNDATLQPPEQPFCGYEGVPVVILPAGIYKAGTLKDTRFRTYLPCAMAILGESAGISPNAPDLRTAAPRREETVIQGTFYFGCIALRSGVEGTLTLDGLSLNTVKVFDERTEGTQLGLILKNCQFTGALVYDLIKVVASAAEQRYTCLEDCRLAGAGSHFGEGRLLGIESGDVTVRRMYFADTEKFPGFTNYSRTVENRLEHMLLQDCLFENCGSVHGLSIQLPANSTAQLQLENCQFLNFAPEEDAAIRVRLPEAAQLHIHGCRFTGNHKAAAVEIDGNPDTVDLSDTYAQGYRTLLSAVPPRRTCVGSGSCALSDPHEPIAAPLSPLDSLYKDKRPYYCDFHCHSNSGGTSDGKTPIEQYVGDMKKLGLDCAAIVDHKQMRHFFLPCWDKQHMICGTEPSTRIEGRESSMDYTMIFPDQTGLAQVMGAFPEFKFTGTWDGHYNYARFTLDRFRQLGEYIYSIGGLLSHAHPLQLPGTGRIEDYYFSEQIAFETVHVDVNAFATRQNHILWVKMLEAGMRIRTHGSSDSHGPVSNRGLTTVYTEQHFSTDIFQAVRSGNCAAGGVGIQMSIDDCLMGGVTEYAEGKQLFLRVGDFHPAHWKPDTVYSLRVYTDRGLAWIQEFDGSAPVSLVLPVQKRGFYRCEVINESDHLPVAFSNPIWLNWK